MRRDVRRVVVLAVVASAAGTPWAAAQTAQPKAPAPAKSAANRPPFDPGGVKMKQLLRRWEQESAKLVTLDVRIQRFDRSPAIGNEQFEGRAILKSPNLAFLDFKKVEVDPNKNEPMKIEVDPKTYQAVVDPKTKQPKLTPHERIICTGKEVWQYRCDTMQIFIYPLDKKDQKKALEEGPLPFLFNMRAAEAEARYRMELINETPNYYVVGVLPKLEIDKESFSMAYLGLNRTTFFPERINLISPNGTSSKDYTITLLKKPNADVSDLNFKGKLLDKPWTVVRDPLDNGGQAQPPARPQQGLGNRQPGGVPPQGAPSRRN